MQTVFSGSDSESVYNARRVTSVRENDFVSRRDFVAKRFFFPVEGVETVNFKNIPRRKPVKIPLARIKIESKVYRHAKTRVDLTLLGPYSPTSV